MIFDRRKTAASVDFTANKFLRSGQAVRSLAPRGVASRCMARRGKARQGKVFNQSMAIQICGEPRLSQAPRSLAGRGKVYSIPTFISDIFRHGVVRLSGARQCEAGLGAARFFIFTKEPSR